ncbi:ATP-dependent DNA helicase [Clostridium sp. 19966]|uniref:ATP-dependent DNA helicase n=1 Tax=Clostridium sp. 19966 TaxID=2768166 RepID=UPI0028E04D4F|nr:ATP-dependent DNA helicase [Clostridium sp. 19966]MDT8717298.1 ATP-dependent DNA helicase [Clostridium sp. 19966]
MEDNNVIKLSVRNLVEFILRRGDLDSRFSTNTSAVEGTRLHQKIQKQNAKEYSDSNYEYDSEIKLNYKFNFKDIDFLLEGRADGIIVSKDAGRVTIDEIKTTSVSLEVINENFNELHWAQAKCYAYMYAVENNKNEMEIQLTYCNVDTENLKYIKKVFLLSELKKFFEEIINKYYDWAKFSKSWIATRDRTINSLEFPFENYRSGQRELAVAVYKTIAQGKKIFCEAPTGIGKTISTLFPSIKAIGQGHASKIFYLTAKTITRQVAEEAIEKMRAKALKIKSITLTAKEKICFKDKPQCNPDQCEYAKGHFDRVNEAIMDMLKNKDNITREEIEQHALSYKICPFEFSLDLALWADCVICDYNYLFDPRASLKRFFDNSGEYVFLIDEAHNLLDRGREMYSAELNKDVILRLKKIMQKENSSIHKCLTKLNSQMLSFRKTLDGEKSIVQKELPEEMYFLLNNFINSSEEWLATQSRSSCYEDMLEFYFNVISFIRIWEIYDDNFVNYISDEEGNIKIKLFCISPGDLINKATENGQASVFFSATLSPMNYYKEVLGGTVEDYMIKLPSPFDVKNLNVFIGKDISTKYRNRDRSYISISNYINDLLRAKKGNYMIFFPSYKYMNDVYDVFSKNCIDADIIVQDANMDEKKREEFLSMFKENSDRSLAAFVVLGGIFSEGIDLKGDKLIGAIIVGVGLPQICLEREIIKQYYNDMNKNGYHYSYMYPGMNKVLQAGGRVIRTWDDRGVILLLDDRFIMQEYKSILPDHWRNYKVVKSNIEFQKECWNFDN